MAKILRIYNTTSLEPSQSVENLFSSENLNALSNDFKYDKCGIKKLDAATFVHSYFDMFQEGKNCLRTLCLKMGVRINDTIHKSSLENRFNRRTFAFVVALLEQLMQIRVREMLSDKTSKSATDTSKSSILTRFSNIYLSDSTCQPVPDSLASVFPSAHSKTGNQKACIRLQVIYNYSKKIFSYFDLSSFRENDQSACDNIFSIAQAGDLIIRDLGYFVLENLLKMTESGIYFLSRYYYGVIVFNANTGERIDLLTEFKGKSEVDITVELGVKDRVPMRLVARKLPKLVAQKRIDKAKKDRNSATNHSAAYYELLKWEIFVTNVPLTILSIAEISYLYQLRWFIEIIFKTWKSYFNFKKILNVKGMSYYRTIITIVLMLIKITYAFSHLFVYIDEKVQNQYNKIISPSKFMDVVNSLWIEIIRAKTLQELDFLIPQFAAHATYDHRKKTVNIRKKFI